MARDGVVEQPGMNRVACLCFVGRNANMRMAWGGIVAPRSESSCLHAGAEETNYINEFLRLGPQTLQYASINQLDLLYLVLEFHTIGGVGDGYGGVFCTTMHCGTEYISPGNGYIII